FSAAWRFGSVSVPQVRRVIATFVLTASCWRGIRPRW
ncbi:hypothetical protein, partial [Pseudomonas savastanoi]